MMEAANSDQSMSLSHERMNQPRVAKERKIADSRGVSDRCKGRYKTQPPARVAQTRSSLLRREQLANRQKDCQILVINHDGPPQLEGQKRGCDKGTAVEGDLSRKLVFFSRSFDREEPIHLHPNARTMDMKKRITIDANTACAEGSVERSTCLPPIDNHTEYTRFYPQPPKKVRPNNKIRQRGTINPMYMDQIWTDSITSLPDVSNKTGFSSRPPLPPIAGRRYRKDM